jgi:Flp pilus assembly protein TadG
MARRTSRLERGAAAVEMAIVLPVLILLVGGIIDFGRAFMTQVILTNAAREGTRVAVVTKDATTAYTRTYDWTITKEKDGEYSAFAGGSVTHPYTVSVDQTLTESDFAVSGTITVQNPNPNAAMSVTVSDSVGGTDATLSCGGTLTVPASSSATCGYTASLAAKTNGTNTATVTLNSAPFAATAPYAFGEPTKTVGTSSIGVTDTNGEAWTAAGRLEVGGVAYAIVLNPPTVVKVRKKKEGRRESKRNATPLCLTALTHALSRMPLFFPF